MIYGYLRVSSDKQDINSQRQGVESLAKEKKWTIDDWILDDGVSGTKSPDERELGPLLGRCQKGDIIICSELSRLGRKLFMVMSILEFLMRHDVRLFTVKDHYELGDNIQSQILAFAFGLSAQIERDMISARTLEGLKLKKAQGVLLGRPAGSKNTVDWTLKSKDEIIRLYQSGVSIRKISERIPGQKRGTMMDRNTIGYYLLKWGVSKGTKRGYRVTLIDGTSFEITPDVLSYERYGTTYPIIHKAFINNRKLMGVQLIEEVFDEPVPLEESSYAANRSAPAAYSDDPRIDRQRLRERILENMTLPEIHQAEPSWGVSYEELYDYVNRDIEFNLLYRANGMKRVKRVKL